MSLYGSSMAQSLGQGTFIFDKIYPNRYLLDTNKDADGVLIGRYALVEYDRPLAVVKKDDNGKPIFTYKEGKKHYDLISMSNGDIDGNISSNANKYIFICTKEGNDNYQYYYIQQSENDGVITYTPVLYKSPMKPFEFNKLVDQAYVRNNTDDDINLSTNELWDSTAWIKTVTENNLKYVKVADLNVLTPTFEVGANITPPLEVDDYGNYNFKPPIVKPTEGTPGSFTIQFPTPLDINLIVNDGMGTNSPNDRVTPGYSDDKTTKQFTINIPEIKAADNAAKDAEDNSEAVLKLIQYPMDNGIWPSNGGSTPEIEGNTNLPNDVGAIWKAIKIAKAAGQDGQASIISAIDTDGITVSIGKGTDIIKNKLNIEVTVEPQNLITSSNIQNFWSSIQ